MQLPQRLAITLLVAIGPARATAQPQDPSSVAPVSETADTDAASAEDADSQSNAPEEAPSQADSAETAGQHDATNAPVAPAPSLPSADDLQIEIVEVETVDVQDAGTSEAAEQHSRAQLSGRVGLRGEGRLRRPPQQSLGTTLPYERARASSYLFARASYRRGRSFDARLSGLLRYQLHFYEPGSPRRQARVYPELRELYVGFYQRHAELRVGNQRIAWGITDSIGPNDVVNARDRRDPFLMDTDLRALPTPTVRLDVFNERVNLQVVAGMFMPDRLDLYGTTWSVVQPTAPTALRGALVLADTAVDPSLRIQLNELARHTERALLDADGLTAGARVGWTIDTLDVHHYYHYGYDSTPNLAIPLDTAIALQSIAWGTPEGSQTALQVLGRPDALRASYVRRHHIGTDVAWMLASAALRLDVAYTTNHVVYTTGLTGFTSPAMRGAIGVEWQTGSLDEVLLLELLAQHLIDQSQTPLLAYDQTTFGAALLFRWPLFRDLKLEVRGLGSFQPWGISVRPELYYERNDVRVGVGALILDGAERSFAGYFRYGNEAYARIKWSF